MGKGGLVKILESIAAALLVEIGDMIVVVVVAAAVVIIRVNSKVFGF